MCDFLSITGLKLASQINARGTAVRVQLVLGSRVYYQIIGEFKARVR